MKKEDIVNRLKKIFPESGYDFGMVVDSKTSSKVKIVCPVHGVFEKRLDKLFEGKGCPVCSGKIRKTLDEFIADSRKIHGEKYGYKGPYINSHTPIEIICPEHGSFYQSPTNHLNGCGCPKCKGEKLKKIFSSNSEEFLKKAEKVHGSEYDYESVEYVNNFTPVAITCPKHGKYYQIPHNHLQGKGCPVCNESKLERVVSRILDENGINYEYQWHLPWDKKYSLDFYLPDISAGIECQGIQHFEDGHFGKGLLDGTKCRDKYKLDICNNNGVDIIYFSNFEECDCFKTEEELVNAIKVREIACFIKSLGFNVVIDGDEILVSEKNFVIGYDDVYLHSEKFKEKRYHFDRSDLYNKNGIRMFHIFSDEWKFKNKIIKSMLSNVLGKTEKKIYARNCIIGRVESKESREFLEENHIQGSVNGKSLGLYFNGELVSMIVFGKKRLNLGNKVFAEGEYELLRFCSKLGTSVVGGASKLFKHFLNENNVVSVISYCDNRWSVGKLYNELGFSLSHCSEPNYYYVINGRRENRFKYRKSELIKKGCDGTKTEHEIMLESGAYRIYDCGCKVYTFENVKAQ